MIHKTKTLLALTASLLVGAAHADVTYSSENFEAGTVNFTIDNAGAGTITQLSGITPETAFLGTAYVSGSTSRMGILASGEPTNFSAGGTIPTGKHAFVSTSGNRSLTLAAPMTLVTDNVQSINVSFSYMLYGLGTTDFSHTLELTYSPSGFTVADTVQIATFGFLPATPAAIPGTHYPAVQDTWTSASLSITASAGVTFTNTAKFRLNKMAPAVVEQMVLLDDVVITGIPAPVPFVATIAPAVGPATGYDLRWTSQAGKTYSVLTSTDLATPVDTWTVVQAGIASTPPQNSYNVPADGVRRFYVIKEIAP